MVGTHLSLWGETLPWIMGFMFTQKVPSNDEFYRVAVDFKICAMKCAAWGMKGGIAPH